MKWILVFALFYLPAYSAVSRLSRMEKACGAKNKDAELQYLCALPERTKRNVPEVYWLSPKDYQKWLESQSPSPAAPRNFGETSTKGDQEVNRLVLMKNGCHFYSSISPSVQNNKVNREDPRTKVVWDFDELLASCRSLASSIESSQQPKCSVVEFAGHSTQAIGLDTIFGWHEDKAVPSKFALEKLGKCLRRIAEPKAYVVFSVCGGDRIADAPEHFGATHYWPGKESAQKKLTQIFGLPILSGIGFVDGTPEGGVTSEKGWYATN